MYSKIYDKMKAFINDNNDVYYATRSLNDCD